MPIHVHTGGGWRPNTDRVYVRRNGRWQRVQVAWVWATLYERPAQWWPMFDFRGKIAISPTLVGGQKSHVSAQVTWTPTPDPTILGHRIYMRPGSDPNGPIHAQYPPDGYSLLPVTSSELWQWGLGYDERRNWTMVSEDEFGNTGPQGPPLVFHTGHPSVIYTNPGGSGNPYPYYISPYKTGTWKAGPNKWADHSYVHQGTPASSNSTHMLGVVSYQNAWGQLKDQMGLDVPKPLITVHAASLMSITRQELKQKTGEVTCRVAPGNTNWEHSPNRFENLEGNHNPTTFDSPKPGNTRNGPFHFADPDSLLAYARTWLGMGSYGYDYNSMILRSDNGVQNADGKGYVSLAHPGAAAGAFQLRVLITFRWVYIEYRPPVWS